MKHKIPLLLLSGFFLSASSALSQLDVHLKLEKQNYIAHDSVNVLVSVMNRSGKAITLAGATPQVSWLTFHLRDYKDDIFSPRLGAPLAAAEKLNPDQTLTFKVNLQKTYALNIIGKYRITANVFDPSSKDYISSETETFYIDDGSVAWQRDIGDGAGSKTNYSLITYRDTDKTILYYRQADAKTGFVKKKYALGDMVRARNPKVAIDKQKQMHVFYMIGPNQFSHDVIGANGEFLRRKLYETEGPNRPDMVQTQNGNVTVTGGVDPEARKREVAEKMKELTRIRRSNERPPGY